MNLRKKKFTNLKKVHDYEAVAPGPHSRGHSAPLPELISGLGGWGGSPGGRGPFGPLVVVVHDVVPSPPRWVGEYLRPPALWRPLVSGRSPAAGPELCLLRLRGRCPCQLVCLLI